MMLPDEMPEGVNFRGIFAGQLSFADLVATLETSEWSVVSQSEIGAVLQRNADFLEFKRGDILIVYGRLDNTDRAVQSLLESFNSAKVTGSYQWITANGELWREMPFDPAMLDDCDQRLPAIVRESIKKQMTEERKSKRWWSLW